MIQPVSEQDESTRIQDMLTQGRAGQPDAPDRAPRRGSVQHQIEEIFFEQYLRYFKNAEERRRWSIERDIPWDLEIPRPDETTACIVESFSAVEMFLPDYTHKIMELIRRSRGRAWFQANWGYEESKHSMVLDRWLQASGARTAEQMEAFERSLLGAEWNLPFETPRQMILYTMIQELATGVNYTNLRRRAIEAGDPVLSKALSWVSADESAHYNFFRRGVKTYLELEPEETVADLKYVFENFAMPAHALIPEWERRGATIEEAGVYGPKVYLAKIRKPVLEDLGISRQQLKAAGLPEDDADAIADRAEERASDAARAVRNRFQTLPTIPPPQTAGRKIVSRA
jgi:acyl-[acyl-carrier-protein] desaturase